MCCYYSFYSYAIIIIHCKYLVIALVSCVCIYINRICILNIKLYTVTVPLFLFSLINYSVPKCDNYTYNLTSVCLSVCLSEAYPPPVTESWLRHCRRPELDIAARRLAYARWNTAVGCQYQNVILFDIFVILELTFIL